MTTDDEDRPGELSIDAWLAQRQRTRPQLEPDDAPAPVSDEDEEQSAEPLDAEASDRESPHGETAETGVAEAEVDDAEVDDAELVEAEESETQQEVDAPEGGPEAEVSGVVVEPPASVEPAPPPAPLRFIDPPADSGVVVDEIAPLATEPPAPRSGLLYSPIDLVAPSPPIDQLAAPDEAAIEIEDEAEISTEAPAADQFEAPAEEAAAEAESVLTGLPPYDPEPAPEFIDALDLSAISEPHLEPEPLPVDHVAAPTGVLRVEAARQPDGRRALSVLALIGVSALVGLLVAVLIAAALFLASVALRHGVS